MKTSLTKLSSSFLLLIALPVMAKPVAQVTELTGTVFVVNPDGKTSALKLNQHLEDRAEVMAEEGATITLNDYYDATYHMTGGSHLKFFDKSVQLKKGKAWIQSGSARHPLALTTANGSVGFWKSEFIATFDQVTSRSQFLVVLGDIEVSNILDKNMKYTVPAGSFTLIDPDVENGLPRTPTKVGLASLNDSISEFKQLPTVKREIASVPESEVKKGEIIFIKSNRLPASVVETSAHSYYKKKAKKHKATPVPIRIFGVRSATDMAPVKEVKVEIPAEIVPRQPASIPVLDTKIPKKNIESVVLDPEFGDSLKKHGSEQPKYSKELDSLINDLQSY